VSWGCCGRFRFFALLADSCGKQKSQHARSLILPPPPPKNNNPKTTTELHYVFASVFGHKLYVVYPILAIVFSLVVIVTAAVGISLTYFQLASEDHRWWWRSFLCGGSTAAYVFGYSVYYWFFRSDMRGLLQATFYYGYCGIACYGLGLMLGSVGFRASNAFVRRIYHEVKLD